MTSVLRRILPGSSARSEDFDDDYSLDYSFAIEYVGPPVNHDIPQIVPMDIHRIPMAFVAATAVALNNLSLPVIQPVVKSDQSNKNVIEEGKPGSEMAEPQVLEAAGTCKFRSSGRVYSRKLENSSDKEGALATADRFDSKTKELSEAQSSNFCVTTAFSEEIDGSNHFSGSLDDEDLNNECNCSNAIVSDSEESRLRSQEISSEISSCEGVEDCVVKTSGQGHRTSAVTFSEFPTIDTAPEESDQDEPAIFPERPVILNDGKKGSCHRCYKRNPFAEKEICLVWGAKYCRDCVLRAMGCMPEGRKCITCISYGIDESKRGSLGKCSRMLRKLLTDDVVKRIMISELSCKVNQLPSHLLHVNDKRLSIEELVMLQSCPNPPKKLKPGKYWYDKVSGFWGKEGEKPSQIISAELGIGYQIREDASNGETNVMINNRKITKAEFGMLKFARIHCEGNPHFWLTADGSYLHEGMKNVMGNLWTKRRVKIVCAALSSPYPPDISSPEGEDVEKDMAKVIAKNVEQKMMNKLLLVGCDQSGTSTIFKQAKNLYSVLFSENEKQNIKFVIQRNVYCYICILLEGRACFEEEYLIEMRRQRATEPGPSAFSKMLSNVIFPAATREYSPLIEELWKDKAFQATYRRRNELHMLPKAANYFLDRAVEITQISYEPSQMDILYAEGIASSNGVASTEFSFPESSQDGYMESSDQNDPPISYQLIRVPSNSLGENCKWLEMFEDVNLVIYCASLTDYHEYFEDINGIRTNKMLASKKLFESIVTHPTLTNRNFLLILNKLDLLEEKIEQFPISECDWFQDFNPEVSIHPHRASNNHSPLAQRAFHYIAVKFKRLFTSLTGRKLFVSGVTGLKADSVDKALRYSREILKWNDEIHAVRVNEWSSESIEPSNDV